MDPRAEARSHRVQSARALQGLDIVPRDSGRAGLTIRMVAWALGDVLANPRFRPCQAARPPAVTKEEAFLEISSHGCRRRGNRHVLCAVHWGYESALWAAARPRLCPDVGRRHAGSAVARAELRRVGRGGMVRASELPACRRTTNGEGALDGSPQSAARVGVVRAAPQLVKPSRRAAARRVQG